MLATLSLLFLISGTTPSLSAQHQAIARALTFLESEAGTWNKERACVSCHNALPILWSFKEVQSHGFQVNLALYDDWRAKAFEIQRAIPAESLAYLILGLSGTQMDNNGRRTFRDWAERLELMRAPDGSWRTGGQKVMEKRRAPRSSREVSQWARLALAVAGNGSMGKVPPANSLPEETDPPSETVESTVLMLLSAREREDEDRARLLARKLLQFQNEDGGWGPSPGEPSEAIATGQSLFAIGANPSPSLSDRLSRARDFLIGTQRDNGSWTVTRDVKGWTEELTSASVYWATAWALMGLSCDLGDPLRAE